MSHSQFKHRDGYDIQVGHLLRIKANDEDGGRLGEAIVQVINVEMERWLKVQYLSASDEGQPWYIDKPGGAGRVHASAHCCQTSPL